MKITALTLLIAAVALVELVRTIRRIRRDELGLRSAAVWALLWAGLLYFAVFPEHLATLAEMAQMRRTLLFASALGIIILFTLVFNLSSKLEKAERQIARLTQELAIHAYESERRIEPVREDDEPSEAVEGSLRPTPAREDCGKDE